MPDPRTPSADGSATPSGGTPSGGPPDTAVARLLCDTQALTALTPASSAGALWKLSEPGRQLDANLVRLPPGQRVDTHAEPDLDVLLLVVTGEGALGSADGPLRLAEGTLFWLPHGSTRSLTAGPDGLSYLTVHRRRPGMQIGRRERTAAARPVR